MTVIDGTNRFNKNIRLVEDYLNAHGANIWVTYRKEPVACWLSELPLSHAIDFIKAFKECDHIPAMHAVTSFMYDDKGCSSLMCEYDKEWLACFSTEEVPKMVEVSIDDGDWQRCMHVTFDAGAKVGTKAHNLTK